MMSEERVAEAHRLAPLRLVWGMIVRPRATLEYLNEQGGRAWWLPALLAVAFVVLPVVVAAPITSQQTREAVLATQERMGQEWEEAELTAEQEAQVEQMMGIAASPLITVLFPAVGNVIGRAVGWLAWAGALYLAGMALGGRTTFGQMFRTVVWAWLPYALRGLLQTMTAETDGTVKPRDIAKMTDDGISIQPIYGIMPSPAPH